MLKDVKLTILGSLTKSLSSVLPGIRTLGRTSSAWWKSNTTNDYMDMTCSSLHTRSNKCIICLIYAKVECMVGSIQGEPS
jgi:hypothetical protein